MKIVLDTNVLIAALISRGVCADLLEHCILRHVLCSPEPLVAELKVQLTEKFKYTFQEVDEALGLLRPQIEIVEPVELGQPACRDPDDDLVLATAVAATADCIVTGDKDLLVLKRYQDVEILNPSEFADFEARKRAN